MAQAGLPGQPEIATPIHTAGIADDTVLVFHPASSGRFIVRVLGLSNYLKTRLAFQKIAPGQEETWIPACAGMTSSAGQQF